MGRTNTPHSERTQQRGSIFATKKDLDAVTEHLSIALSGLNTRLALLEHAVSNVIQDVYYSEEGDEPLGQPGEGIPQPLEEEEFNIDVELARAEAERVLEVGALPEFGGAEDNLSDEEWARMEANRLREERFLADEAARRDALATVEADFEPEG